MLVHHAQQHLIAGAPPVSFYNWAAEDGASGDWRAGFLQDTVVDGAAVSTWDESINSYRYQVGGSPTYDADGANGRPSLNFNGSGNRLSSSPTTTANLLGTQPVEFEMVVSLIINAAPTVAQVYEGAPIFANNGGLGIALKTFEQGGVYYVSGQVYNDTNFYRTASVSLGASLPSLPIVVDFRWESGVTYCSVNNGTEVASSSGLGARAACNSTTTLLGLEDGGAPVYANMRLSRVMTRASFGTRTSAAILAEMARLGI